MINRPIALLTDFGLKDHYVGSMKSAILGIHPKAVIFDITHDIRPQQVEEAAFVLDSVYPYVPQGTIFVAVVDPGVGSKRRAICIRTKKGFLVGPDNGIFSRALLREKTFEARKITNNLFFQKPVSLTFHGWDIFPSVAARLSKKEIFNRLGPRLERIERFEIPEAKRIRSIISGEVVYIDRFGNAMTNISIEDLGGRKLSDVRKTLLRNKFPVKICSFFGEGKMGELIGLWSGNRFFEIAVKEDSAEARFRIKIGDAVSLFLK